MTKCFIPLSNSLKPLLVIVGILSLMILFHVDGYSEQIDTLVLQLQWKYPISISDMKLSDLDLDGINEILYGTNSASSKIGIADVADQIISYQSQALAGSALTVAAGYKNEDNYPDIIVGGTITGDSADIGYFQTFDGPGFDSVNNVDSVDNAVTAVSIYKLDTTAQSMVYVGTFWHHESYVYLPPPLEIYDTYSEGHLFSYNTDNLIPVDTAIINTARKLESYDLNNDNKLELIVGGDYYHILITHGIHSQETSVQTRVVHSESTTVINLESTFIYNYLLYGLQYMYFDALTIGDCNNDGMAEILVSYRTINYVQAESYLKLCCYNGQTNEIIWNKTDSGSTDQITGLAICDISNKSSKVVCAAYKNGLIRYKSGVDGTDIAISDSLPKIDHLALGNLDQDSTIEICIASDESLYIFEAPFITTDVEETSDQIYPQEFSLFQNFPNPFNSKTEIRFKTSKASLVDLTIYNILGQTIRNFERYYPSGSHMIDWDGKNTTGTDVASGIYFYSLTAGEYRETKKMLLLK